MLGTRSNRFFREEDITPENIENALRVYDQLVSEVTILASKIDALALIVKQNKADIATLKKTAEGS
jgi:hypothetical protein